MARGNRWGGQRSHGVGKFGNRIVWIDGIKFHSGLEAERWLELRIKERAGLISKLQRQFKIWAIINEYKVFSYKADYVYVENKKIVIEDAKGHITEAFSVRWKVLQALYGEKYIFRLYPHDCCPIYAAKREAIARKRKRHRRQIGDLLRSRKASAKLPGDNNDNAVDEKSSGSAVSPGHDAGRVRPDGDSERDGGNDDGRET